MTAAETLRKQLGELPEGRCLAGFSGGADSTAMMLMLAAARDDGRIQPEAVHVNHGLRDAESDGDEEFCRRFCAKLRIPFHAEHAFLDGKSDENACREARFRCFRKVMDSTGIRTLVLAHNRDDLAETFLMRLFRGAGMEGLACMSARDERDDCTIYRPMLRMGREEIREALSRDGIRWREDSLNESAAYLRNRIRSELIPTINDLSRGATERIANAAEILAGENEALQGITNQFLAGYAEEGRIDTEALQRQPKALQSRILRAWWKQNAPELEEHTLNLRQTAELKALASSDRGKVNLPGGLYAVKSWHGLYLTGFPKETPEPVPFGPEEIAFGGIRLRTGPTEGNPGDGITEQEVPAGFFRGCVIRTRREGDRIRPFGMKGSRKLQDYFTDRGVDEPLRDRVPLICRGQEVLFAAGVGAGAVPRWDPKADNIRLKWLGRMPWNLKKKEEAGNGSEL